MNFLRAILLCAWFCTYFTFSLNSQNFHEFMKEKDTIRKHNLAYQLFRHYISTDLDTLQLLGNELLAFSNTHRYSSGIYLAYHILGDYFIEAGQEDTGIYLLNEAKEYYFSREDFYNLTILYNAIGTGYHRKGSYEIAIDNYEKSLICGEMSSGTEVSNIAQNNKGKALMKLKKYGEARKEVESFKDWAFKHREYSLIANACSVLGEIALEEQKYEIAMHHFIECQQFAKQQSNESMRAVAYTNMGIVYFLEGDLKNSSDSFFSALEIRKKIKTINSLCDAYLNCGGICFEQGNIKEAIQLYNEGEQIAREYKKYKQQIELLEALIEAYQHNSMNLEEIEAKLVEANINLSKQKEESEQIDVWFTNEFEKSQLIERADIKKDYTWYIIGVVAFSLGLLFYLYKRENL